MPEALLCLPAQTCKGLTDSVFLKIATGIDGIILEIAARKGGGKIWRIKKHWHDWIFTIEYVFRTELSWFRCAFQPKISILVTRYTTWGSKIPLHYLWFDILAAGRARAPNT